MQDFCVCVCLWQLCSSVGWAWRWHNCLGCEDPGGSKCAGTWTASATGVMALSESFFEPLIAGNQKASLASLSSLLCPFRHLKDSLAWGLSLLFHVHQAHRGVPLAGILLCRSARQSLKRASWLGSYSVDQYIRHLKGHPGWGPTL